MNMRRLDLGKGVRDRRLEHTTIIRVMSIDHSVLLLSLPGIEHLRSPSFLTEAIKEAVSQTQKSLLVIVFSPLFSTNPDPSSSSPSIANAPAQHWKELQDFLMSVYSEASRESLKTDNILLSVDVVLLDPSTITTVESSTLRKRYDADKWEAVFALDGGTSTSLSSTCSSIYHITNVECTLGLLRRRDTLRRSTYIASPYHYIPLHV